MVPARFFLAMVLTRLHDAWDEFMRMLRGNITIPCPHCGKRYVIEPMPDRYVCTHCGKEY